MKFFHFQNGYKNGVASNIAFSLAAQTLKAMVKTLYLKGAFINPTTAGRVNLTPLWFFQKCIF